MTTAKRLGLVSVVLISVGASAAYYATSMAMRSHGAIQSGFNYLVLGLVAIGAAVIASERPDDDRT